jgi:hypothetical protein
MADHSEEGNEPEATGEELGIPFPVDLTPLQEQLKNILVEEEEEEKKEANEPKPVPKRALAEVLKCFCGSEHPNPAQLEDHRPFDSTCPCSHCVFARAESEREPEGEVIARSDPRDAPPSKEEVVATAIAKIKKGPPTFYNEKEMKAMNAHLEMERKEKEKERKKDEKFARKKREKELEKNALIERKETWKSIGEEELKDLISKNRDKNLMRIDPVDEDEEERENLTLKHFIEDVCGREMSIQNVLCRPDLALEYTRKMNPEDVPLYTFTEKNFVKVNIQRRYPGGYIQRSVLRKYFNLLEYASEKSKARRMVDEIVKACSECVDNLGSEVEDEAIRIHDDLKQTLAAKYNLTQETFIELEQCMIDAVHESRLVIDTEYRRELQKAGLSEAIIDNLEETIQPAFHHANISDLEIPMMITDRIKIEEKHIISHPSGPMASLRFTTFKQCDVRCLKQVISQVTKQILSEALQEYVPGSKKEPSPDATIEYSYTIDESTNVYQVFFRWLTVKDCIRFHGVPPSAPYAPPVTEYEIKQKVIMEAYQKEKTDYLADVFMNRGQKKK